MRKLRVQTDKIQEEVKVQPNFIAVTPGKDDLHAKLQMYLAGVPKTWIEFDYEQIDVLISLLERTRDKIAKKPD